MSSSRRTPVKSRTQKLLKAMHPTFEGGPNTFYPNKSLASSPRQQWPLSQAPSIGQQQPINQKRTIIKQSSFEAAKHLYSQPKVVGQVSKEQRKVRLIQRKITPGRPVVSINLARSQSNEPQNEKQFKVAKPANQVSQKQTVVLNSKHSSVLNKQDSKAVFNRQSVGMLTSFSKKTAGTPFISIPLLANSTMTRSARLSPIKGVLNSTDSMKAESYQAASQWQMSGAPRKFRNNIQPHHQTVVLNSNTSQSSINSSVK